MLKQAQTHQTQSNYLESNTFLQKVAHPAPLGLIGKARPCALQIIQGIILLIDWGVHTHRTSQTRGYNPNQCTHMLRLHIQLDKPLCFGSTLPASLMPYTLGLGNLSHTMGMDIPNQSISPFKATHNIPASHPAVHSALIDHYYTCSPNSSLYTQPTANKCYH